MDKAIVQLLATATDDHAEGVDKLQALLLGGDRESATQYAMENDMWAHALIIAQSHHGDHFKHVIQGFMNRQLFVNTDLIPQVATDQKSLRMLYSVFSGAGADAGNVFTCYFLI